MSDEQHEPSYYEIALTGKQVTGAFVVVLVSLLVAFFAGVWIGRGAPREVLADTGVTAPAPAPAAGTELSFFADRPAPVKAEVKPEVPPAQVAQVEVAPPPPHPVTEPEPDTEPVVASPTPAPVEPPPAPAPKPVVKPEPAKPPTAPAAATPLAPVSGPLVIQVFTSSDQAKAKDMLNKLKARSFKAYLSPTKTNGKAVYRVRVGPFTKEADAKAASDRIEKHFKVKTWITRSP